MNVKITDAIPAHSVAINVFAGFYLSEKHEDTHYSHI
jgi:hypothetical protein